MNFRCVCCQFLNRAVASASLSTVKTSFLSTTAKQMDTNFSTCRLRYKYSILLSGSALDNSFNSQLNWKTVSKGSEELKEIKLGLARALYSDILFDEAFKGSSAKIKYFYNYACTRIMYASSLGFYNTMLPYIHCKRLLHILKFSRTLVTVHCFLIDFKFQI